MKYNWVQMNLEENDLDERVLYYNADTFFDLEALVKEDDTSKAVTEAHGTKRYWYDLRAISLVQDLNNLIVKIKPLEDKLEKFMLDNEIIHLGVMASLSLLGSSSKRYATQLEEILEETFPTVSLLYYELGEELTLVNDNFNDYVKDFNESFLEQGEQDDE